MRKLLVLLLCLILCGCASIGLRTNGYLDVTKGAFSLSKGNSFFVVPNSNSQNTLFDKEIKAKIEKLLITNGYIIKSDNEAQYFLTYNYSIDNGKTVTGVAPVYNPGQTVYTQGTVSGAGGFATYSGTSQSSGYTSYVPFDLELFTRSLQVKVTESDSYKKNEDKEPVWIGDTVSSGSTSDLRAVIDYLLVTNFKYFGKNTGKPMRDDMSIDNKEVKELRGEVLRKK
jgi:hypothetical protein